MLTLRSIGVVFLLLTSSVLAVAEVTITGPKVLCEGTTATLSAPAGMRSYRWNTGATTQSITVSTVGTYRVDVVKSDGSPDFGTIDLQPGFSPRVRIGNPIEYLCNGDEARLEAPAIYKRYLWSTGDTTSAITVTKEGTYSLTVVDSNDCVGTSDAVRIIVVNRPQLDLTGPNAACRNVAVTYSTSIIGGASYTWSINGGTIVVGQGTAAVSVQWQRSGVVSVLVQTPRPDGGTCDTTISMSVNVGARLRPEIIYDRSSLCSGDTIILRATNGFASYLWSTGATTSSITVTSGGPYWVAVTDSSGCSGASDTLTVFEYPNPDIRIPGIPMICNGSQTQLTAVSANNDVVLWEWSTGERTASINVGQTGRYRVIGWTINGCTDTAEVYVGRGDLVFTRTFTDITFPTVRVGTTVADSSRIQYQADGLLRIQSITEDHPELTLIQPLPTIVDRSIPLHIPVRWTPATPGVLDDTITVVIMNVLCPDTLYIRVTGRAINDTSAVPLSVSIMDTTTDLKSNVRLPVYISIHDDGPRSGSFLFDVTFDRREALLHGISGAQIINDVTIGDQRTITVYLEYLQYDGDTTIYLNVVGLLQPTLSATFTPRYAILGTQLPIIPMYRPGTITFTGCWLSGRLVSFSEGGGVVRHRYDMTGRELDPQAPCRPCIIVDIDANGRVVNTYLMNNISR